MTARAESKSQKIRDYIAANPEANAGAVQTALKKDGIRVSMALVYGTIGRARKRRGRGKKAVVSQSNDKVSLNSLLEAKKLVERLGSLDKAKVALDALAKLSS